MAAPMPSTLPNPSAPNMTPLVHIVNGQVVTGPPMSNTPLTGQAANDLTTTIRQSVEDLGQADAERLAASGDAAEATAYTTAAAIAGQNQRLATAAGGIEQAQIGLKVSKTLGGIRAGVAAAGFANSGTSLDILRSSTRQGALDAQLAGVNSSLQAGGYQAQGAAATAESDAAAAAAAQAGKLADTAATVGQAEKTNAISEAATLGLTIPGLSDLSATNMPSVNPTDLLAQNQATMAQTNRPTVKYPMGVG